MMKTRSLKHVRSFSALCWTILALDRLVPAAWAVLGVAMVLSASAQIQHTWTRSFGADTLAGMSLDGQSNLCAAGTAQGDFVTIKYAPGGSILWSNRYDGGSAEEAHALAADGAGQVWVSGITQFTNTGPQRSALTVKYSAGGSLVWAQRFHTNVYGAALSLDGAGNC